MSEGVFRKAWWQPPPRRNFFSVAAGGAVSLPVRRSRNLWELYEVARQQQIRSRAISALTARRSDPLPRVRQAWELYAAAPRTPIPLARRRFLPTSRTIIPSTVIRRKRTVWPFHLPPRLAHPKRTPLPLTLMCPSIREGVATGERTSA